MDEVLEVFRRGSRFLLLLHLLPDGDSIGSTLALMAGLEKMGKEVTVCSHDAIPACYRFLAGSARVVGWERVTGSYDAAVLLDCGDLSMAGGLERIAPFTQTVMNLDHHATNSGYGDVVYLVPEAAAAGELAHRILGGLGVPLDAGMATCLYTALVCDTGSFRYSNTNGKTHRLAADLVDVGVEVARVNEELFENRSKEALDLLGIGLGRLRVGAGGRLAWTTITEEDMAAAGAGLADSEGIINYPRSLRGVDLAMLFRENGNGGVKVSFRSREGVDVAELAKQFGGGGHAKAAGCVLNGSLSEVQEVILEAAARVVGGR